MYLHALIMGFVLLAGFSRGFAAAATDAALEQDFHRTVQPFMKSYCVNCHAGEKAKAQLDLSIYSSLQTVVRDHAHWELILERIEAKEMPPAKEKNQPDDAARQAVIGWIDSFRRHEARKNAGDPGPVLARRLSNAEYDYTIRDLTGVDIRPTKEFPVDPANQAGFDNSGESLAMSPALLKKYLQAARQVADHAVIGPHGLKFAPHPMAVETDRDKYCIFQIVEFYRRQPTDYADYFAAAWRFKHRADLGNRRATLAEVAANSQVSPKYLALIWSTLAEKKESVGPLVKLQAMWRELPAPDGKREPEALRARCVAMRDYVTDLRAKLEWDFKNLELKGFASGSQPFIGWKNRQFATHRRKLNPGALQVEGEVKTVQAPGKSTSVNGNPSSDDEAPQQVVVPADPGLTIPADPKERARHVAAFERFCDVFPDTFYRAERGRMHFDKVREKRDKGRYLSAGFHNMMGYFRDDLPLYELILDEKGQRELDDLWLQFDFVARVPERQHAEFIFYERAESRTIKGPEFDFARSEDPDVSSDPKIQRLAEVYLAKARESLRTNGGDAITIAVIEDHFRITSENCRRIEKVRLEAEPKQIQAMLAFAERAYRRPLAAEERDRLAAFYKSLRGEKGLGPEEAIRDCLVSILMSPHFCYRVDLVGSERRSPAGRDGVAASARAGAGTGAAKALPLSDHALASRLSYFLWSSMPDAELLAHAAAGDLHRPEILVAQTRRMLKDPRARGLAVEFSGNWLDYRRFEEHNAVDRDRFPAFNHELRQAMFEEPVRFFLDVMQRDRSVLDFIYASDTFVNPALAKHYGLPELKAGSNDWVQVADARAHGRGGILPMSVFLTKNAPGLRTSPVKRGYWVVRRVLGEQIPPPPAVVPELPHDEAKLDLPLREVLAKHREDPSCAACHSRFDSMGLVFEAYGPVGEKREVDLAGRPVDARATFPGGMEAAGFDGLRQYIREHREDDFVDNICRKMFAYALGRTLILSDDVAIEAMRERLAKSNHRFSALIESIVTSPQFLNKRSPESLAQN